MTNASDDRLSRADVPPVLIRALLRVAQARGLSPARLCLGLGFTPEDLGTCTLRVSYRQTRALAVRVHAELHDPALGLAAGQTQSPLSWGMPGLAMMTCRTLGQAMAVCAAHQSEAGALVSHGIDLKDGWVVVEARPRFHDTEFERLLVEETFAAIVTVVRALVGVDFAPSRVEFALPRPAHAEACQRVLGCNVHFDRPAHRMWTGAQWLTHELPGWDPYACDAMRAGLASLMQPVPAHDDLLESALAWLRNRVDDRPSVAALACDLNLGERTLRRRLAALGVSWRALLDQVRREHALELLQRAAVPVHDVASATGFGDARAFRRAFRRWTGARPTDLRQP